MALNNNNNPVLKELNGRLQQLKDHDCVDVWWQLDSASPFSLLKLLKLPTDQYDDALQYAGIVDKRGIIPIDKLQAKLGLRLNVTDYQLSSNALPGTRTFFKIASFDLHEPLQRRRSIISSSSVVPLDVSLTPPPYSHQHPGSLLQTAQFEHVLESVEEVHGKTTTPPPPTTTTTTTTTPTTTTSEKGAENYTGMKYKLPLLLSCLGRMIIMPPTLHMKLGNGTDIINFLASTCTTTLSRRVKKSSHFGKRLKVF
jgi:hypothetical protein